MNSITATGEVRPDDAAWDDFFAAPGADMPDRDQPEVQGRELF